MIDHEPLECISSEQAVFIAGEIIRLTKKAEIHVGVWVVDYGGDGLCFMATARCCANNDGSVAKKAAVSSARGNRDFREERSSSLGKIILSPNPDGRIMGSVGVYVYSLNKDGERRAEQIIDSVIKNFIANLSDGD